MASSRKNSLLRGPTYNVFISDRLEGKQYAGAGLQTVHDGGKNPSVQTWAGFVAGMEFL